MEYRAKIKTRRITLIGIPLPSIYVATNDQGVWEVIDGVQRLSTIFEFMGDLRGPLSESEDNISEKPPLILEATKHLPSLEQVTYAKMDSALRLEFKRTRLDIKVLAREQKGASTGKFDLFERLNTYGEPLSPQELRNCILVSLNPNMFRWLRDLAQDENFRLCSLLSETQLQEKYDMDLALRFCVLRDVDPRTIGDVHEFLRDRMELLALDEDFDFDSEAARFRAVFKFLMDGLNGNALRAWNAKLANFRGGFSLAAFEGLALSIGRAWPDIRKVKTRFSLERVVKQLWDTPAYRSSFSGLRARERMVRVSPTADEVVQKEIIRAKRATVKN